MGLKEKIKAALPEQVLEQYREKHQRLGYERRKSLPDERIPAELAKWFHEATGERLDLENPQTFNQKIQWLKLYGPLEEMGRLSDKYLVREFVAERIGEEYLVPLLGVWDDPADIDFDRLPQSFALKATHGCGWNIIVPDKSQINPGTVARQLRRWIDTDYAFWSTGFEMQYHYCEPRAIAEQYMTNDGDLYDYKFWCFDGRVESVMFLSGRNTGEGLHMAFYSSQWELLDYVYSYPRARRAVPRPQRLEEMLELASELSRGFPHVRVDLYLPQDGKIRFGEMTFTSMSGTCRWDPPEANLRLGQMMDLGPLMAGRVR